MADQKISELTSYTPAIDTDVMPIVDTTTGTTKKITWANIKATLLTYFNGLFSPKLTTTAVKTSNYTANPSEFIPCDVSGGGFTIQLPTAPADGTIIEAKIITAGNGTVLELKCGGSDFFNKVGGNTSIYVTLLNETHWLEYKASLGVWYNVSTAPSSAFAMAFTGIDATTPITNANISIDTSTRVLTITPPLGYFYINLNGNGVNTRIRKTGTINFPAFTDTSGMWYFYFNSSGTAVATQTPWSTADFPSIASVYRVLWNASLVGSAKLVAQYIEYHLNDLPAEAHQWFHLQGTQWVSGFTMANNAIVSGAPNADGRNSVIALTTGTDIDDNLEYTVTNNTSGNPFTQDLGNTTPASLNSTNSALFKTFIQDAGGLVSFLPATRFPFPFNSGTNHIEYITSTGTRTTVPNGNFLAVFVYATQNPVTGDSIKVITSPTVSTSLANAQAINWINIQTTYSILGNDNEIRPLYRLIFEERDSYNIATKYGALRETQDLRKAPTTTTATASGSLPATSVTFVPSGTLTQTNVQSELVEIDSLKAPLRPVTEKTTLVDADEVTGNDSASTFSQIRTTWTNVKVFLKTYFDTLYATIANLNLKAPIASPTFTGTVALGTSPTMTTPVITGLPTGTGVSSSASVSTIVSRDANANTGISNVLEGYATTATAGASTTLTVSSKFDQYFTGSTTQTVVMPVVTTLTLGQAWWITNNSTGLVTVNSSGGNAILVIAGGTSAIITCIKITADTTASAWSVTYFGTVNATGKKLTVNNTITFAGTDGTTMTLPATSLTLASLTGTETFSAKRINPRLVTAVSYTTDTGTSLDVSTCDQFEITAQAGALLFNSPSGTPLGGQKLIIRIKDNGTARALTYNAIFRAMGNALPSTTVLSKTLYMGFIYNATDSKWDLVAVAQEA